MGLLVLSGILMVLASCGGTGGSDSKKPTGGQAPPSPQEQRAVFLFSPKGETVTLEVAGTPEERERGLMFRPEVPRGTGMYFGYGIPDRSSFWMKNCLTALDIIWLDQRGVVVHLVEDVPPCREEPCPVYRTPVPASQVVELGPGEARRLGIAKGVRLILDTSRIGAIQ